MKRETGLSQPLVVILKYISARHIENAAGTAQIVQSIKIANITYIRRISY